MSSSPRSLLLIVASVLASCAHDLGFLDPRDAQSADASDVSDASCALGASADLCDPVANCGCGPSQTCAAPDVEQRRARCVRVGAQPEGAVCLGPGECERGSSCLRFTCRRACRSASDCRADERCVTDDSTRTIGACTRVNECSVLPSSGCSTGVHCRVELLDLVGQGGQIGVSWCEELNGAAGEGGDCESDGCVDGLYCSAAGQGFHCVRPCTDGAQCTDGARPRCDRTTNPVTVESVTWGECAQP